MDYFVGKHYSIIGEVSLTTTNVDHIQKHLHGGGSNWVFTVDDVQVMIMMKETLLFPCGLYDLVTANFINFQFEKKFDRPIGVYTKTGI